jgi:RHS repeat-associated protein
MEQDEESEYIQMGARTYNPALGRFMSVDPLFEAFPGQSAYSYAFNSPLSWSDPSGLAPEKERKRDRVLYNLLWQQVQESIEWSNSIDNEFSYFRSLSSTLFMSEEYNGIGEVYKGGGGSSSGGTREGEGQDGSGNTAENGTYVASIKVNTPKKWDSESIDRAVEESGVYKFIDNLKSTTDNEVGFLLIWNEADKSLSAAVYIGIAEDKWLDLTKEPTGLNLDENEQVIGFHHTHTNKTDFSAGDIYTITRFSLGTLGWTHLPKTAEFNTKGEVTRMLNNNYKTTDRMYFGLSHPEGRNVLGWERGNGTLKGLYQNIMNIELLSAEGNSYNYFKYLNLVYNVDLIRKKK